MTARVAPLRTAAALLAGLALAACGSGADRALRTTLAALGTPEPRAPAPAASAPEPRCTGLTASLRPPATMPTPGAMPAGSELARIQKRGYLIAGVDQNTLLWD
jgi:polar amino acid transport system substrate-binding protein